MYSLNSIVNGENIKGNNIKDFILSDYINNNINIKLNIIDDKKYIQKIQNNIDTYDFNKFIDILEKLIEINYDKYSYMLSLETNISINKANKKIDLIMNYLNKCRDEFDSYENEIWTNNNLLLRKKGSILISLSGYDPLENLINALIPALWLNNNVYVKVSRKSPLCVSELLKDLNNLYPLNNKLNLLIIENPVLIDLIENNYFNFVYWTGSFQSAKLIEKVCIDNNIEFAFEGSGQDILYIDISFDNWSFFNEILIQSLTEINGNNCNAIKIIAIDDEIYSKTILEIEKVIKSIKIQQNINDLNELSIGHQKDSNIENISKILDYFSKYKSISSFNNKSNLISPILYFDVNLDDIFKYEILGPIIFTVKSKDINEIIEMTRRSPFGLSLTLLSKKYLSKELLKKFDISRLNINCNPLNVSFFEPWGGIKKSGTRGVENWLEKFSNKIYIKNGNENK